MTDTANMNPHAARELRIDRIVARVETNVKPGYGVYPVCGQYLRDIVREVMRATSESPTTHQADTVRQKDTP